MPLYLDPATYGRPMAVYPGQQFTLFNLPDAVAGGLKSQAFECMPGLTGNPSPQVFSLNAASATTATYVIQASNDDVEAHYQTVGTIPMVAATNGYYADLGEFRFYRGYISAYSSGPLGVLTVQR